MKPTIKRSRKEAESDTTECETNERPTQPRRIKGRRNKQRNQLTKRQVMPSYVPRYDLEIIYCRFLIKQDKLISTSNCKKQPSLILKSRFYFSDCFELQKIITKIGDHNFTFSLYDTKQQIAELSTSIKQEIYSIRQIYRSVVLSL